MGKYDFKVLRTKKKDELVEMCASEGIVLGDGVTRPELMEMLLNIDEPVVDEVVDDATEEAVVEAEPIVEVAVDDTATIDAERERAARMAYEAELSRRMGGKPASNYELELARRRGAGARISGADAVAIEIERRRRAYGSK